LDAGKKILSTPACGLADEEKNLGEKKHSVEASGPPGLGGPPDGAVEDEVGAHRVPDAVAGGADPRGPLGGRERVGSSVDGRKRRQHGGRGDHEGKKTWDGLSRVVKHRDKNVNSGK